MSKKKRKSYSREFKMEAVGMIIKKGYSIAKPPGTSVLITVYCVDRKTSSQMIPFAL